MPGLRSVFEDFQTCGDAILEKMVRAAERFCLEMLLNGTPRWLTLVGASGAGKTMLLRGIMRYFHRRLADVRYEEIRDGQKGNWMRHGKFMEWSRALSYMCEGDYSFLRNLEQDWFVGLDDIGAEYSRMKELSASKLYELLCRRERKWTVITANLSVEDIGDKLDLRIASRLLRHGSVVVDCGSLIDYNLRGALPGAGGLRTLQLPDSSADSHGRRTQSFEGRRQKEEGRNGTEAA